MTGTLTPFQVRLRQRTDQGFQILELDEQAQRAKLRVRVNLKQQGFGQPIIATGADHRYTCRLIEVDEAGELHDDAVPCD